MDARVSTVCDWQAGDEFIGDGNTRWRIVSVIPLPRIEEFVERPTHGAWQVEPLHEEAFTSSQDS